jgi:hypothetical protein
MIGEANSIEMKDVIGRKDLRRWFCKYSFKKIL